MKNNALGCLLLKSLGAGYSAANIAGRNKLLQIFEFSPLAEKSQLLVIGPQEEVTNFIASLRTLDIDRTIIIPDISLDLLSKYLGKNNSKMKSYLLIFENQFCGDLFITAKEFMALGLDIVDFRVIRTSGSPSYLIMTGDNAESIKEKVLELKRKNYKITYISQLSENFRQFFDVKV